MSQTKLQSVVETTVQTVIGLLIAITAGQLWIYPHYGLHPALLANVAMTLWFTLVGTIRHYFMRRLFNWWDAR